MARLSGMSLPTVRRRWRDGELPGAYRNPKGHIRVPHAALDAVRNKRHTPTGLSQRYVADALWVLRRVLGFARANGLAQAGFDPTESLDAPTPDPAAARTRRPTRQPRPLTLPECARIAAHLQPVHQIVFWLQRIMGLRISEAFGVLLGDVIELGDTAPARRPRPRWAHLQRPRRPRHPRRRPLQADDEDRGRLPHARRASQDAGTDPPQHRRLPRRPRSPARSTRPTGWCLASMRPTGPASRATSTPSRTPPSLKALPPPISASGSPPTCCARACHRPRLARGHRGHRAPSVHGPPGRRRRVRPHLHP